MRLLRNGFPEVGENAGTPGTGRKNEFVPLALKRGDIWEAAGRKRREEEEEAKNFKLLQHPLKIRNTTERRGITRAEEHTEKQGKITMSPKAGKQA